MDFCRSEVLMHTKRAVTTLPRLPFSCWEAATTEPPCDPSRPGASRAKRRPAVGITRLQAVNRRRIGTPGGSENSCAKSRH